MSPSPARHVRFGRWAVVPLIALAVARFAAPAGAQSTWLGGQTVPAPPPYLWDNPANWVGGAVPAAGGDVLFADPAASISSLATTNNIAGLSLGEHRGQRLSRRAGEHRWERVHADRADRHRHGRGRAHAPQRDDRPRTRTSRSTWAASQQWRLFVQATAGGQPRR